MIQVCKAVVLLMLCFPLRSFSQTPELPLPRLDSVCMVVKMYHSFMPPPPGSTRHDKDTESVFWIGRSGYADSRYFCKDGYCSGQESYEYADGKLVGISRYASLDRHTLFSRPRQHSHQLISDDAWKYRKGRVEVARHTVGPDRIMTREIRYEYDDRGRVETEHHQYPRQSVLKYNTTFDYVDFQYDGDTVYRLAYKGNRLQDSTVYVERRNSRGQITEVIQLSPDDRLFERELMQYDSVGRITVLETFSGKPAVQEDGTVLRIERVEYTYDSLGRPDEVRCYAGHIKRWAFKYHYVK